MLKKEEKEGCSNTLASASVSETHGGTAGITTPRTVVFGCHMNMVSLSARDLTRRFHRHLHPVP
jgi:hypothetical protein